MRLCKYRELVRFPPMNTNEQRLSQKQNILNGARKLITSTGLVLALCGLLTASRTNAANNDTPVTQPASRLVAPANPKEAAAFQEALEYLSHSAKAREIISYLQNCDTSCKVVFEFAPSEATGLPSDGFVRQEHAIYWIPDWGFRWNHGFASRKQTAAVALLHEMGHAYHAATDPARYERDCKPYSDAAQRNLWTSPEEKRTIKEIENVVSKELNEPLTDRHNWTGVWADHYKTLGPKSTVERKGSRADDSAFSNFGNN